MYICDFAQILYQVYTYQVPGIYFGLCTWYLFAIVRLATTLLYLCRDRLEA